MGSYMRGTTITLRANISNWRTGTALDVDSIACKIYQNGVLVKSVPTASVAHEATGTYKYDWETSPTQGIGLYVYVFDGKYGGKTVGNDAIVRVRARKRST